MGNQDDLEIPWLKSYVGQKIGNSNRTIDAHGAHLLVCVGLTGDFWRACHDKMKHYLFNLMLWGKMQPSMEVGDIFSSRISTNVQANVVEANSLDASEDPNTTDQDRWNGLSGRTKQGYGYRLGI